MKGVYFTSDEWARVEALMERARVSSFSDFARVAVLHPQITVNERAGDVREVLAALAPIGTNVNQVARHVNTRRAVELEELHELRKLLEEAVRILAQYRDGGVSSGDRESHQD
jgi:hypothetical protein